MAEAAQTRSFDFSSIQIHLPQAQYKNLPSVACPKFSSGLAVSSNHLVYRQAVGELAVLSSDVIKGSAEVDRQGRAGGYGAKSYTVGKIPVIRAGGSEFADFCFDSFHPNHLFTAHTSGVLKGWTLAKHQRTEMSKPDFVIEGLGATLNSVSMSSAVENGVVCSGEDIVSLINPITHDVIAHWDLDGNKTQVLNSTFSWDNSLLRCIAGNNRIYNVDIRGAKIVDELKVSFSPKGSHVLNSSDIFLIWGNDSFGRALYQVYDPRNTSEALAKDRFPKASGHGLCAYDPDTMLLYYGSRNSTSFEVYDTSPCVGGRPLNRLLYDNLDMACQGFAIAPKQLLGTRECARCYTLTEDSLMPIETRLKNQTFKNCTALEPAITLQKWLDGANSAKKSNFTYNEKKKDLTARKELKSKFLNVEYNEPPKLDTKNQFLGAQIARFNCTAFQNARVNTKYIIYAGPSVAGGRLGVSKLSELGTRQDKKPCIRCHAEIVTCFDISMFDEDLIATGANDSKVFLWRIPEPFKADIKQPEAELEHTGKVRFARFHPVVPNILVTCDDWSLGDQHYARVRVWNVETREVTHTVEMEAEGDGAYNYVTDFDFNALGDKIVITTADKMVKVINLRKEVVEAEFSPEENRRELMARFVDDSKICAIGFRLGSKRYVSLWDISGDSPQQVQEQMVDKDGSHPLIHVDKEHKLLYFSGIGQSRLRTFEFLEKEIYVHKMSHICWEDLYGWAYIHKQKLDVKNVEINKFWRLGRKEIVPVSLRVMRKRKEYFQDDLYEKILPYDAPVQSYAEWAEGQETPDHRISLQPADLAPLSLAPPEQQKLNYGQRKSRTASMGQPLQKKTGAKSEDAAQKLLDSVKRMDGENWAPDIGQWTVQAEDGEVDSDEWSS